MPPIYRKRWRTHDFGVCENPVQGGGWQDPKLCVWNQVGMTVDVAGVKCGVICEPKRFKGPDSPLMPEQTGSNLENERDSILLL